MGIFSRTRRGTATIRRIWHNPPPGAPWYYWTYVLFDVRGESIQVKLGRWQSKGFVKKYSEGQVGHLVWSGKNLKSWTLADAGTPIRGPQGVYVFLSYAHRNWRDDADYIAQVLKTHGLEVWRDEEQLRTGDRLSRGIERAIKKADYLVALLSPDYFASPWCVMELEAAAAHDVTVMPINVSGGQLTIPPHLRSLYEDTLGNPLHLDIRKRDPSARIAALAEQMLGAD